MTLDPATRKKLSERAKQRRVVLGLSCADLAARLGVSGASIANWELLLPKKTAWDAAWETALMLPPGGLRDCSIEAPPLVNDGATEIASEDQTLAQFMRAMFVWYSRKKAGERTTNGALLSPNEHRVVEILSRRFGCQGEDQATLQAIGDHMGLTRERVRQIVEKATQRIEPSPPPVLLPDRLRLAFSGHLPCRLDNLPMAVQEVLGENLSLEGADRFFREVLGERLVNIKAHGAREKMVVADDGADEALVAAVRQSALDMIRQAGAAQLFVVTGAVLAQGLAATLVQVANSARVVDGFEWLVESDGWFWFGPGFENKVRTSAMKVLAAANRPVDIEEIYLALARARFFKATERAVPALIAAPLPVLQILLGKFRDIKQSHFNDYRLDCSPTALAEAKADYLSPSELLIVGAIVQHGGIAPRRALMLSLVDSGRMEKVTFDMTLFVSPVFKRHDRALWAIAGYSFTVEALQGALSMRDQLQLIDGWYELEVTLPRSAIERGDWLVPAAVAPYLVVGDYEVQGASLATRFVTNPVGGPYLKSFSHILTSAGVNVESPFVFGIAASGRVLRARELSPPDDLLVV